ncbi:hypothetical protein [Mucilaginibacter sp. dw_454]|uniref:hypothetical protein n=1 Tax=Mucilaginibacter sp. dw_454 TaxID=2720079 RepID=UPI001BD37FF6|nr:hypothetical protein [Mucilaginibacter sp. dw_454]
MKKCLLTIAIYLSCAHAFGQSTSLLNLINMTSLNNEQAGNNLTANKAWALQYGEDQNGMVVEHYQTTGVVQNKKETIILGQGYKTANGGILHTISYVSPNPQDVINLAGQAKASLLIQNFRGSDKDYNIYIYESILYHMVVRISLNNDKGVIDITQKQIFVE